MQDAPVLPDLNLIAPFVAQLDCLDVKVQSSQRHVAAATSNTPDLNAKLAVLWRVPASRVPQVRRDVGSLEAIATRIVDPKAEESFKAVRSTRTLNAAIGNIEADHGQAEANRLKAERLRVPGARGVAELEKFRLWAENGARVPTTLIVGGEGEFWLSPLLGVR